MRNLLNLLYGNKAFPGAETFGPDKLFLKLFHAD